MKKYLSLFLILFALCGFGWHEGETLECTDAKCPGPSYELAMSPIFMGGGGAAATNECDGAIICQNFEGTGYDNSESWTEGDACDDTQAVCNEDYATAPAPLRGSQSMYILRNTEAGQIVFKFADQTEISGHFRMRWANDDSGTFMDIRRSTVAHMTVGYNATNNKYINGTNLGATAFTVPEVHYVWFHFKEGTGENEINRWWYSASSRTWPGDGNEDINFTAGTSTGHVDNIRFQASSSGDSVIIDQIVVKTGTAGLENIEE